MGAFAFGMSRAVFGVGDYWLCPLSRIWPGELTKGSIPGLCILPCRPAQGKSEIILKLFACNALRHCRYEICFTFGNGSCRCCYRSIQYHKRTYRVWLTFGDRGSTGMAKTTDDQGRGLWRAPAGTIDRLLKDKGWTRERMAELSGVSEKTIYNLEKHGVSRATLVKIATTFGLPPESMAVQVTEAGEMERFYPLVGLQAEPPVVLSDSEPYQDWTQHGDDQVIEYLWAEAIGSTIQAEVLPKQEEMTSDECRFLRVSFKNVKDSYPGNVAIHPRGMRAVVAAEKRLLVFQARLAEREDPECEPLGIGIAVRVRDARLEHWQYKVGDDNYVLEDITKEAPDWQTFEVDLTAGSGKWNKLTMGPLVDGQTPDFSVITGIVFEIGQRGRFRRPDKGEGTVDIGGIFLRET